MKQTLVRLGLAALLVSTLVGCGGGGGGASSSTSSASSSSTTTAVTTSGSTDTVQLSPTALSNLSVSGSVQGVTINSPPVISFQLVNSDNNTALAGLEQWTTKRTLVKAGVAEQTGGTTDNVAFYPNISFSIAKLVPGSNGSPNRWVSYMVSTPSFDSSGKVTSYAPGRPGSENNGTMESLGNGQYKYTFRRDIKEVASQVAAFTDTSTSKKADLDDLNYDPSKIHRLVIQISGAVRGSRSSSSTTSTTGYCNTEKGVCPDGMANTSYTILRTPVDLVYDWIPATGLPVKVSDTDVEQREVVNVAACASCHNKFTFHGGNALTGVGGGRQETRQCVVCHTDQRKFGRTGSTTMDSSGNFTGSTYTINGINSDDNHSLLDFPVMIHKIHMGEELTRTGYNIAGVEPNHIRYPQLITNCAKCHSGDSTKSDGSANTVTKQDGTVVQMATVQGNNWNTKPSRKACGACHDGINFNTGLGTTLAGAATGHGSSGVGGVQLNDSNCATCHTSAAIKTAHVSITLPNSNSILMNGSVWKGAVVAGTDTNVNAAWLASNLNNLPSGAIKVSYDIKSVSRNTSKRPVIVFRMLQNGARKDFNAAPATGTSDAALTNLEMWDNFLGSPSVYFVWAQPQDGITSPADFNASASGYLRSLWNGKASGTGGGSISIPDAEGYYTVTLTGVIVPDGAVMLTGGVGYTYNQLSAIPLTQTNLSSYPVTTPTLNATIIGNSSYRAYNSNKTGGLIVVAPDAQVVASSGVAAGGTGGAYTGRRAIVSDARCNNCHQELGVFNKSSFHAGQRNDGATCSWCHTPNRASSGWSADSTNFVHAIHGKAKRSKDFTWHAISETDGFWKIGYPGVLKNCEACHLSGTYDFSNPTALAAAPNRQLRTAATGTFSSTAATLTKFAFSPWITQGVNYGSGFSVSASTGTSTAAAGTTLVESPTASVCFACHDDSTTVKTSMGATAKAHMEAHGGSIYVDRTTALTKTETCLTSCHAPTSSANIKAVHSK